MISKGLKSIIQYVEGLNGLILMAYLLIVCGIRIFLYNESIQCEENILPVQLVILTLMLFVLCPFLIRKVRVLYIPCEECNCNTEKKKKYFIIFFIITLTVLGLYYAAYAPGNFSNDSISQYQQANAGSYSDWHPVIHTLLAFTLPLKLTGGIPESVILFQIVEFALIIAYMAYTLAVYGNPKYALFCLIVIMINPVTGNIAMRPWKDLGFAMASLLLMVYSLKIYSTKGDWLERRLNIILFSAVLAIDTMLRHNAILFTFPLFCGVLLYCNRKRRVRILLLTLVCLSVIKGPLYFVLEVEKPEARHIETMGMPLTIIGNVVVEDREALDKKTEEFAYAIASQEMWEEYYVCGNFNSIKWAGINGEIIEKTEIMEILRMTLQCIWNSPKEALKAFFSLGETVFSIDGDKIFWIDSGTEDNEISRYKGNVYLAEFFMVYSGYVRNSALKYIFLYIGTILLIMLLFILSKTRFVKKEDWKRLVLLSGIFVYDFGTMLLLTGYDHRFFYVTFLVWPVVLLIMMRSHGEESNIKYTDLEKRKMKI